MSAHVKMEMRGMRRICAGSENRGEIAAGRSPDPRKQRAVPHIQRFAVLQTERRDINRVAIAMLADFCRAVTVAAPALKTAPEILSTGASTAP